MPRSPGKTLLVLAALIALLLFAACGSDDDDEGGGTPAQSAEGGGEQSVTEQLFAGSASDNRADPAAGRKGGKLTVLAAGDVDYMDRRSRGAGAGVGRREPRHHGPGAGDPVDVGLPDRRRLAERARRAERLQHDLGLELHLAAVAPPGRRTNCPHGARAMRAVLADDVGSMRA